MKVIKPQQLGVLTRSYEFRREFQLGISALAFVPLGTKRALIPELAMWPVISQQMDGSPLLDVGIPKSKAEYLVVGSVHAPHGEPTPQCTVMAEVAGKRKLLMVTGDREWRTANQAALPSQPVPFESMPLTWKRAFGGSRYPGNPDGRGYTPESGPTPDSLLLPNLEYPTQRVVRSTDTPEPAGYGPVDVSWAPRAARAGTHDNVWLERDFPGFARDIAWEFFNLAPPDQWFDEPFAHDAPYELYNMHPERAHMAGALPGLRARCFVQRRGRDQQNFSDMEEVSLALTTLWFFPSIERVVMVFHGSVMTAEDDASDISHLMVAAENASTPIDVEHYRAVTARRCDREKSHLYTLKDSELCPAELMERDPVAAAAEADADHEDLARQRQLRRMRTEIDAARARGGLGAGPGCTRSPPA
ncbi:MAG: hypothetical protein RL701_630 [Pseudomonadota bacterium]